MALNLIRGFRRIGWVITLPVAALTILAFYEKTKEFSPTHYDAAMRLREPVYLDDQGKPIATPKHYDIFDEVAEHAKDYAAELPNSLGKAYFSKEVPKEMVDRIITDFVAKQKSSGAPQAVDDWKRVSADNPRVTWDIPIWTFKVHKQINKLKLTGLVTGSLVFPALFIQGFISILAWVFRGFKG